MRSRWFNDQSVLLCFVSLMAWSRPVTVGPPLGVVLAEAGPEVDLEAGVPLNAAIGGAPAETGAAGAATGAAGAAMAQAVDTEAGPPVDAATGAPGAATGAAGAAISEPVMPVDLSMDSSLDGILGDLSPGTWTGARARANSASEGYLAHS
ncbi:hypothetical protein T484DRAFT_1899658, partial [Baffinella frigidus]